MKRTLFNRCQAVVDCNYQPANRMITTTEEIETVNRLMGLDELNTWDLQNLRDLWVLLRGDSNNRLQFNSVVSVIDSKIYKA